MAEPYMPSNGTEGEIFMGRWCAGCIHDDYGKDCEQRRETAELKDLGLDAWADREEERLCEILGNALAGIQPDEWIADGRGPRCTSFAAEPPDPFFGAPYDPEGAIGDLFSADRV